MNYLQRLEINQFNHQIAFHPYDILKIERYEIGMEDAIFVSECEEPFCHKENTPKDCIKCDFSHFNEIYINGFCINVNIHDWEYRPYIATLQTGIKVPINEEVYYDYIRTLEFKPISTEIKPIIVYP